MVVVVVPALNEQATIGAVVRGLLTLPVNAVVVVDGDGGDNTAGVARAAGAEVVREVRRGYGRACTTGADKALELGADIIAFVDGGGAEELADLPDLLGPLRAGQADLVLGSRTLGRAEPGALRPLQRLGNELAVSIINHRLGGSYTDLGSMRALTADAWRRLELTEMAHGWPTQMQVRALELGLRVCERPIAYRRRRAGRSKVAGTFVGSFRAGVAILRVAAGGGR